MKKIPTLFIREFSGHKITGITDRVTPGMEWVMNGEGEATIKFDGSCCAIIDGRFYKRYDAKKGRTPPADAIPCCDPDPVTGHWPHWVPVKEDDPADKWFWEAYSWVNKNLNPVTGMLDNGTYEAIGPHFQGNPYRLSIDMLVRHGWVRTGVPRTFEGIRDFLGANRVEGLVFWKDGEPRCKIKRSDFGFEWPIKEK